MLLPTDQPAASKRCCTACVIPVGISSAWLGAALAAQIVTWIVFALAAAYGSRNGTPLHGYEWVWGVLVVPFGAVCICLIHNFAHAYSDAERAAQDNRHLFWIILATIFIGSAFIGTLVSVPYVWIIPAAEASSSSSDGAPAQPMMLHNPFNTVTPSVAPLPPDNNKNNAEKEHHKLIVGVLLLIHFMVECFSATAFWQYIENREVERLAREESGVFDVTGR